MANGQIDLNALMQSAGYAVQQSRAALQAVETLKQQNAGIRHQLEQSLANAQELRQALARLEITRGSNPELQYIENVPGRRVPFDYLVDIPIGPNITSVQQGTITISQEGPFVAVRRFCSFISNYQFQYTEPTTGAISKFNGRTFGRYRPIHSAWDLNDGRPISTVSMIQPFPGDGSPQILNPSNASSFRSMQGDFRIKFLNAGASFPRSNIEVPSTFWTESINDPFDLGALDFFERGEVMTFNVLPTHANNASYGNVFGFGAANPAYPFAESQWDGVEGISDPVDPAANQTDPILRAPSGILTIGFHGYRIVQQPSAGYS